jgi:tetratricopeptide (TPR) repeat protein
VIAVFARAAGFEFVQWDDDLYVTQNAMVQGGLTWKGVVWAFTSEQASNWHPLTGLSHMLDVELFGDWAGGHHLTSIVLHAVNTVLCFVVLSSLTGRSWPSAFAAALFGVHPLHVESVAWVAERKDVLSTLFAFAAIGAWTTWTRRGGAGRYLLALGLFALGLMSKPMLVTLPCVLLLLCVWPLDRARELGWRRVIVELMPWFLLSVASSIVTLVVQRSTGAMDSSDVVAFPLRLANAFVTVLRYLGKTVWPQELAVLYPHPYLVGGTPLGAAKIAVAVAVVLVLSGLVLIRRRAYLTVGWLWFLGTLVPVLGLVQVGSQAMADRYTYLPLVGLFVALAFGIAELAERARIPRAVTLALGLLVVGASAARAWTQLAVWRDSTTLFERSLAIEPNAPILLNNYGRVLLAEERFDEAEARYRQALAIVPGALDMLIGLAVTQRAAGNSEEALEGLRLILSKEPENERTLFEAALTLQGMERSDEALRYYDQLLGLDPEHARAYYNRGFLRLDRGDVGQAIDDLRATVRLTPGRIEARNNLAWLLASSSDETLRSPDEAVEIAEGSVERSGRENPVLIDTLGVAYASAGRFEAAMAMCDEALALAKKAGQADLAHALESRRSLYAAGRPFVSSLR